MRHSKPLALLLWTCERGLFVPGLVWSPKPKIENRNSSIECLLVVVS